MKKPKRKVIRAKRSSKVSEPKEALTESERELALRMLLAEKKRQALRKA